MAFLTEQELKTFGFKHVGQGVKLSSKASFHNAAAIEIGDFSRIDDFCVISAGAGGVSIGRNVHVAVFCCLIGAARIELHDFSNLSSRVSIYTSNDDYSGKFMTNPTVSAEYTGVTCAPVTLEKHVIVGSGTIILPGVRMYRGSAAGALSMVKHDCEAFGVYCGVPARRTGTRSDQLLEWEKKLLAAEHSAVHGE